LPGLLAPMRGDIVKIESAETGQPLPESYQPAQSLSLAGRPRIGERSVALGCRRSGHAHNARVGPPDLDRISLLLGTYLFEVLSPVELEPLARSATIRRTTRGEYVYHVDDAADEIYLVVSGQLKDSIVTDDGDELVHTFFGPGMLIGEPGFFAVEKNCVMAVVAVE